MAGPGVRALVTGEVPVLGEVTLDSSGPTQLGNLAAGHLQSQRRHPIGQIAVRCPALGRGRHASELAVGQCRCNDRLKGVTGVSGHRCAQRSLRPTVEMQAGSQLLGVCAGERPVVGDAHRGQPRPDKTGGGDLDCRPTAGRRGGQAFGRPVVAALPGSRVGHAEDDAVVGVHHREPDAGAGRQPAHCDQRCALQVGGVVPKRRQRRGVLLNVERRLDQVAQHRAVVEGGAGGGDRQRDHAG